MNTPKEAVIVTLVGGVITAIPGRLLLRAVRARTWTKIQATVTDSHSDDRDISDPEMRSKNRSWIVHYTYTVGSQAYTSRRWSFDGSAASSGRFAWTTEKMLNEFPIGAPIEIYYDPAQPESSVVTRKISWSTYFALALGLLFLLGGSSLLVRLALRALHS